MSKFDLKVGDKVKLLVSNSSNLTKGKIYEIIKHDNLYPWIRCDGIDSSINPDSAYWELVEQNEDINYLELIKGY